MTPRRSPLVVATVVFSLGLFSSLIAQGPLTPFSTLRVRADDGALSITSAGPCGSLGPLTNGANIRLRADDGALLVCGDIGGTPAGSDTQVQFNAAGAFGADDGFTYNATTNAVTIDGNTIAGPSNSFSLNGFDFVTVANSYTENYFRATIDGNELATYFRNDSSASSSSASVYAADGDGNTIAALSSLIETGAGVRSVGAPLVLKAPNAQPIEFYNNTTNTWDLSSSGHVVPGAASTYDVGASASPLRFLYADDIKLSGLDNTNPVVAGQLWNDNGALRVSSGTASAGNFKSSTQYFVGSSGATTNTIIQVGSDQSSLSTGGTLTRSGQADNDYLDLASGSVSGNAAEWRTNLSATQARWNPTFEVVVWSPNATTNVRFYVGLTNGQFTDSDTPPNHSIGFRFSSVAGDAGWIPFVRDGSTTNPGAAIGSVTADTKYVLRLRISGSSAFFSVNGSAETQLSANLPGSSTAIGPDLRIITQTGAARSFKFSRGLLTFGS